MSMMAILMGIGVGYIANVGRGTEATQSRALLRETAFACLQSSNGGTRAILDLRERPEDKLLLVGAAIADPVLTHNFETLDGVSRGYPLQVIGNVESVPDGYTGRAGKFSRGGTIAFEAQSAFAMTEGLTVSVWLKPERGGAVMTLAKAEGVWELDLVQSGTGDDYDIRLKLPLVPDSAERTFAQSQEFRTTGGVVKADGRTWTHLGVVFDGTGVAMRVDGLERFKPPRAPAAAAGAAEGPAGPAPKRIAIPEGGVVRLVLSDGATPYVGRMDELVLGGVFRSAENQRELRGLKVLRPRVPLRVTYRNGRLDPDEHAADVVLLLQEVGGRAQGATFELRLGLHGTVEERLVGTTALETKR